MKRIENSSKELRQSAIAFMVIVLGMIMAPMMAQAQTDYLYISDLGNNTIKKIDINNGNVDTFVSDENLSFPNGLLFVNGNLLVASQNAGLNIPGAILQYDGTTGDFQKALVSSTDKNAPSAPRGIIIDGSKLYVADLLTGIGGGSKSTGRIRSYALDTGNFLGDLDIEGIKNIDYHPRGMVFGPDSYLYVSFRDLKHDALGGHVLRFNPNGSFDKVFIADDGGVGQLNRPEGLVFGPDGNLYITSFRANPGDTDSIRIYFANGTYRNKIDLYNVTLEEPRAYAQAILFGPDGYLFVPIYYPNGISLPPIPTGELRRYNVADNSYVSLVAAYKRNLIWPSYLTFGKTDPKFLSYQ